MNTMPRERVRYPVLLTLVLFGLLAAVVQAALPQKTESNGMPSLAPMLEQVMPAVVNVSTLGTVQIRQNPLFNDPFFRHFFDFPDMPRERKTQSLGSGVIVDAERGLVLTNNHVIANADQIKVTLRDGREFSAELIGTDPATDVAVIKIQAENLNDIELADSDELRVGDYVVAIGNPFGLGQTVTSGIVSALARSGLNILGYENFIQTDASINPGNSGGALVNLRGELVGINTAIFSRTGGNIGIGFAIPINLAMTITEQLLEYGEVKRGSVGVQIQDLTPELAEAFGLKDTTSGAVIVQVLEDSPAERVGLQAGDIVLSLNDVPVVNAAELRNRVGLMRAGETINITVLRDGEEKNYEVTISEDETIAGQPSAHNERLKGLTLTELDQRHPLYGEVEGVIVAGIENDSPAWRAGLREGDVITSVNRQGVVNVNDFLEIVDNQQGALLLRIVRGNTAAFIVIQ